MKVTIEHYDLEGNSVTAGTSSSARLPGRARSTAPTTPFCLPLRRPPATRTLGEGDLQLPGRDFGRKDKIVKITYGGMAKECKPCKFEDGTCTTGFRKQHERTDPNCRLHGVTDRGNSRPRQSSEAAPSNQPPPQKGVNDIRSELFQEMEAPAGP